MVEVGKWPNMVNYNRDYNLCCSQDHESNFIGRGRLRAACKPILIRTRKISARMSPLLTIVVARLMTPHIVS